MTSLTNFEYYDQFSINLASLYTEEILHQVGYETILYHFSVDKDFR
jgi:hypothetical protein